MAMALFVYPSGANKFLRCLVCGQEGERGVVKQHLLVAHWGQRLPCRNSGCDQLVAVRKRGAPEPCLKCDANKK